MTATTEAGEPNVEPTQPGAPRTARARARAELTLAIKETARRHLATEGAAGLSLRAVARDLGMVSSALYRYFASRDELLTALIVDAYDAVGTAAEEADAAAVAAGAGFGARWLEVARAVRRWAVANPSEFALVFGSPVPGYQAPQDTILPATRIPQVMAAIFAGAADAGELTPPGRPVAPPHLVDEGVTSVVGGVWPADPYGDLLERSLLPWTSLIGSISFELFGHLHNVVTDYDEWFDVAVAVAAESIGLDVPLDRDQGRSGGRSSGSKRASKARGKGVAPGGGRGGGR